MKYLGWDCANKTLAYALLDIPDEYATPKLLLKNLDKIKLLTCDVVDVLNGEKVCDITEINKAKALKQFLLNAIISTTKLPPDTIIIIEHQPIRLGLSSGKTNMGSSTVAHQLAFYYCDEFETQFISPKLKNNIYFTPELTYEKFVKGYANTTSGKYNARKRQTKENFLYFINNYSHINDIKHINKKFYKDVADAFIQIIAYIINK